jgi:uncharacterized protein YhfF
MATDVFAFGDFREMADQLARLVRDGVKTATCSALWREAHRKYFSRQHFKDRAFDEQMPLVCERFRVVRVPPF